MRELQDQLEAEQYFSVSLTLPQHLCVCLSGVKSLAELSVCTFFSDALQNSGQGA